MIKYLPSKFVLGLYALIIVIGLGLFAFIKHESDYIREFHGQILPIMATKSFFIGCIAGSKSDVQFCKAMQEAYKFEIQRIAELKEDE